MIRYQSVFITGASSGIGAEFARQLAKPGISIALVARRKELLQSLADEIARQGASPKIYALDVGDTEACANAAHDFLATTNNAVDLVIANAGIGYRKGIVGGNAAEIAQMLRVNVIGVSNTIVPFVEPMLRQNRGSLVAIGSMAGHRALPGRGPYSASKAAIKTFMDGLRLELANTGVHAMTICPGFIETPILEGVDHPTPFLTPVKRAVTDMLTAVGNRATTYSLPWQMRALVPMMKLAPEWVIRQLVPMQREVQERLRGRR